MQLLPEFIEQFKGCPIKPGNDIHAVIVELLMKFQGGQYSGYGTTPMFLPFGKSGRHAKQDHAAVALDCYQPESGTPGNGSESPPALKEGVGKIEISISMVAAADEYMRTDQLLAGGHFSLLSDHVSTGKLLV